MQRKSTKKLLAEYSALNKQLKKRKHIIVLEEELKLDGLRGLAYVGWNIVKLDKNMGEKERLGTLLHEVAHLCFPKATENQILKAEKKMVNCLWKQGYRRVNKGE